VFFDYLENLSMLRLSSLLDEFSDWNEDVGEEALQSAFNFATKYFQNHDYIIVFHSWSTKLKNNIVGLCQTCKMVKKWMGMNHMHLTLAIGKTKLANPFVFL